MQQMHRRIHVLSGETVGVNGVEGAFKVITDLSFERESAAEVVTGSPAHADKVDPRGHSRESKAVDKQADLPVIKGRRLRKFLGKKAGGTTDYQQNSPDGAFHSICFSPRSSLESQPKQRNFRDRCRHTTVWLVSA